MYLLTQHVQVYLILDEFIMGGEIQETSKKARRCNMCPAVANGDGPSDSDLTNFW